MSGKPRDPGRPGGARSNDGAVARTWDWSGVDPSTAVVETVAGAGGRDPVDLEPVFGAVDPDALNALVRSGGTAPGARGVSVSFTYAGRRVTVRDTGEVRADPTTPAE